MAGVVCDNCGTSNPPGRQFCESCDGFLDWTGQPAPAPVPPAPPPAAPPPQARPPQAAPPPRLAASPPPPPPPPTAPPYRPAAAPPAPPTQPAAASYPGAVFTPVAAPPASAAPRHRICSNCGTASDPTRRFCRRCGTWLVTPTLVAPAPPDRLGTRLRRRWWGGTTGAYTGDLTRGTIAFRILSIFLVLALIALVLTVAGFHPIRRATDLVGHVLGSGRVANMTARAVPADAVPGIPADWVVDDIRARGFATRWTLGPSGDPNAACGPVPATPATASSLVLAFPARTDVREIGIEAGLPEGDPQITSRWRPRTLELRWSDGRCQALQLEKVPGLQRFDVEPGEVVNVSIAVVAGYGPENGGTDRLDIGEITFWQR